MSLGKSHFLKCPCQIGLSEHRVYMKSIQQRFLKTEERFPRYSTFVNYSLGVEGLKVTDKSLSKWFKRLVNKDDYDKADFKKLLRWVASKTTLRMHENEGKRAKTSVFHEKLSKVA